MCGAGIVVLLIALWAARSEIARRRGLAKMAALANACFALPLAVFGALHLADVGMVAPGVPSYMPWKLFWAYFVGAALVAAGLSIAAKVWVRWSGPLFGIMMFLFVAMMEFQGALAKPGDRFGWTFVVREISFGVGGWILAGSAMGGKGGSRLITLGRVIVAVTALFYGVEHFLHPEGALGVPLEKATAAWIPGRLLIGYLTGVILVIAGGFMLVGKETRRAATYLGTWIVLVVLLIYGPMMIAALRDPSVGAEIEGINYFADTLLFAGAVLALADAETDADERLA